MEMGCTRVSSHLRADHDRQTLRQIAHHVERDAAGAHDDRGPELGDRHAGLLQSSAGLLARAQVAREVRSGIAEPAQVDETLHAGCLGRRGEGARRLKVELLVVGGEALLMLWTR